VIQNNQQAGRGLPRKSKDQIFEENRKALLAIPQVAAVALGKDEGNPCILVFVNSRDPKLKERIRGILEGVPVKIIYSGDIKAL